MLSGDAIKAIKDFFIKKSKMTAQSIANLCKKFLSECDESIISYLNDRLKTTPEYESINNLIVCIALDRELSKCRLCGKVLSYTNRKHEYCSLSCSQKDPRIIAKKKETILKNFGSYDEYKRYVNEKTKHTCREKYNTDHVSQTKEWKEKTKDAFMKNFGASSYLQSEAGKTHLKQLMIEKFGVENISQTKLWKDKVKKTSLNKFGETSFLKTNECRDALSQYMNEHKDDVIAKRKKTCLEKYR